MRLAGAIGQKLGVRSGEGATLLGLIALTAFTGLPILFSVTGSTAIFLSYFEAEDLPLAWLVAAFAAPVAGLIHMRLRAAVPIAVGLPLLFVAMALVDVVFWWQLDQGASATTALLALAWADVEWSLLAVSVWDISQRMFTAEQGRRLMGLALSGEGLSAVVGGFLVSLVVAWLSVPGLFLVSAVGCVGAAWAARRLLLRVREEHALDAVEDDVSPDILRHPYARSVLMVVASAAVVPMFVEVVFLDVAEAAFPDPGKLAVVLGWMGAVAGVLGVLAQTVGVSRWLTRVGLKGALLTVPLLTLVFASSGVVAAELGAGIGVLLILSAVVWMVQEILGDGLGDPALFVLQRPLPLELRERVNSVGELIIGPVFTGGTSIVLLLATHVAGWTARELAIVLVVVAGLWTAQMLFVGRAWAAELARSLRLRLFSGRDLDGDVRDQNAVLASGLGDPRPAQVVWCMGLLSREAPQVLDEALPGLLAHRAPEVRRAALDHVRAPLSDVIEALIIVRLEAEEDPVLRGAIMSRLAALAPALGREAARAGIGAGELAEREGALDVLIAVDDPASQRLGRATLHALATSQAGAERCAAARVLVRSGDYDGDAIVDLVNDTNPAVRWAAIEALADADAEAHADLAVEALDDRQIEQSARTWLAGSGAAGSAALARAWGRARGTAARVGLVLALADVQTQEAAELLAAAAGDADPAVSGAALRSLALRGRLPVARPDREVVVRELAVLASIRSITRDLALAPQELLARALRRDQRESADRLRLAAALHLGLTFPADSIGRMTRESVEAITELLDAGGDPWIRAHVLPAFVPNEEEIRAGTDPLARAAALDALCGRREPWMGAWTAQCARWLRDSVWNPQVEHRIRALREVSVLKGIPDRVLWLLARGADTRTLKAGELLFQKGARADALYIVNEGMVDAYIGDVVVRRLPPGEVAGELAALSVGVRALTVRAAARSTLLRIHHRLMAEVRAIHPEVSFALIDVLAHRLRTTPHEVTGGIAPPRPAGEGIPARLVGMERVLALRAADVFREVSEAVLHEIASRCTDRFVPQGERMMSAGDPPGSCYVIVYGEVVVHSGFVELAALHPGATVGEMGALTGHPRSADVTARTDCLVLELSRADLVRLVRSRCQVADGVLGDLVGRLQATMG